MAGRGRAATSLTHEQMASLGLMGGNKDMSQSITAPPPVFPALMSKPVALEVNKELFFPMAKTGDYISFNTPRQVLVVISKYSGRRTSYHS